MVELPSEARAGRIEYSCRWDNEVKRNEIHTRLTTECRTVSWQAQELGMEGTAMWSEILRASTHSDEL